MEMISLSEKMRIIRNEQVEKSRKIDKSITDLMQAQLNLLNIYFTNTTK